MPKSREKKPSRFKKFSDKKTYSEYYRRTGSFLRRRPFASFFIVLAVLFLIIVLGNILLRPKPQPTASNAPKTVTVFSIGQTPRATFLAKVDNPGVVKILALSGGVVQDIAVSEGDAVTAGQQMFTLSTNYQGGNAPAVQAQIADAQYKNVQDTFDAQNNVIAKMRDIANINHDNFSEMQNIATQSANDTNNLINANQTVLDSLNQQLTAAQNSGAPQSTIIPLQSQINQLQAGQNQLKMSLSNLQLQTDSSKSPGRLADTQRDLTMQQLDIQGKSLELNKEVSKLQAEAADIMAATMYPASPFAAIVQKVYVRVGQSVSPGTPLALISATDPHTSAIVDVPKNIAQNISTLDAATLYISNSSYPVHPAFVPTEATNGSLYSIVYPIPDDVVGSVSDGEYLTIDIPVGHTDTSAAVPFIPLDAIFQTQDSNYVLVAENGRAVARQVGVGQVYGSYAEITHGLNSGDLVILDRNVIAGDRVKTN